MDTVNVIWHYRDLRIEDNPALFEAAKKPFIALYIHYPEEEGAWRSGAASNWWLYHSLKDLEKHYQKLGGKLVIQSGPAEAVFEKMLRSVTIKNVYYNCRYEPALLARDKKMKEFFKAHSIEVQVFEGNYLITPSELFNQSGGVYSVYTPFSKAALADPSWRDPLPKPNTLQCVKVSSQTVDDLHLLPKLNWVKSFSDTWQPGREGALEKLQVFLDKVHQYKAKRDFPNLYATSRLSPHLHFGEISPHEIFKAVKQASLAADPYLKQLLWREFGNYFLFHFPKTTDESWQEKFRNFPWKSNPQALKAWQTGRTGYPIVDAGMRELWQTGWMHNRVRMIVGSFLIKDLLIHWIEGAKWFWDTLVDADLANNTLGWQWVAGCGADAAPYFRVFNPTLQGQKFDPDGSYVKRFVPELNDMPTQFIHCPWESPLYAPSYPPPIVDHGEARQQALAAYERLR